MMYEAVFKILAIIGAINSIIFDNPIIDIMVLVLIVCITISSIINGVIFSKKTFHCLPCEYDFNLKWYQFAFTYWRHTKKYRRYKKIDSYEYERVYVKCPKCKDLDCIMK